MRVKTSVTLPEELLHCDQLVSLPKGMLTDYVRSLTLPARQLLARALQVALELD
jgi:mRNA interferase MazF